MALWDVTEQGLTEARTRLGDSAALHCADILRRKFGIWVSAVVYPAVRHGNGIIRVIPTALHERSDRRDRHDREHRRRGDALAALRGRPER